MKDAGAHWDDVYSSKPLESVGWFETRPETSLRLLTMASPARGSVVDVGSGASFLVDALLDAGWSDVTVLDVSSEALDVVRARLAGRDVSYAVTDLLAWQPDRAYDAWHDRAVFHFLTGLDEQRAYVDAAAAAVVPGGAAVLGVFAEDGPTQCSGLPTARHSAAALEELFSASFVLEHSERVDHVTPAGVVQPFTWVVLRRTSYQT